jgi:chromosome segregation ATPase
VAEENRRGVMIYSVAAYKELEYQLCTLQEQFAEKVESIERFKKTIERLCRENDEDRATIPTLTAQLERAEECLREYAKEDNWEEVYTGLGATLAWLPDKGLYPATELARAYFLYKSTTGDK